MGSLTPPRRCGGDPPLKWEGRDHSCISNKALAKRSTQHTPRTTPQRVTPPTSGEGTGEGFHTPTSTNYYRPTVPSSHPYLFRSLCPLCALWFNPVLFLQPSFPSPQLTEELRWCEPAEVTLSGHWRGWHGDPAESPGAERECYQRVAPDQPTGQFAEIGHVADE